MNRILPVSVPIILAILSGHSLLAQKADPRINFFLTSSGPGKGANLGGLTGADRHCQLLAKAAGLTNHAWRAYLSTSSSSDHPSINARDRIGDGPWYNFEGARIAQSLSDLHSERNNLTKQTQLSEKGDVVNGRGDSPNRHDILTGSRSDGRAFSGDEDTTCLNWTSSGIGSARVGHHDRTGGGQHPTSWNSAHGSRGCSQENLRGTGGDGLFYCFASN